MRLLAEQAVNHGQVFLLDSLVGFATLLVVQTAAGVQWNRPISTRITSQQALCTILLSTIVLNLVRLANNLAILVPVCGYFQVELDARILQLSNLVRLNICDALHQSSVLLLDLLGTRPALVRRAEILGVLGDFMTVQRPGLILLE